MFEKAVKRRNRKLNPRRTQAAWRIHAWALMGNHYRLLLETPEANLVSGMKWLPGADTDKRR